MLGGSESGSRHTAFASSPGSARCCNVSQAAAAAPQAPAPDVPALETALEAVTRRLEEATGELEQLGRERDVAALDRDTFQEQVTALRTANVSLGGASAGAAGLAGGWIESD